AARRLAPRNDRDRLRVGDRGAGPARGGRAAHGAGHRRGVRQGVTPPFACMAPSWAATGAEPKANAARPMGVTVDRDSFRSSCDRKASLRWRLAVKLGRSHFMVRYSRRRADEARGHRYGPVAWRFAVARPGAGMIATAWERLAGDRISTFQRWVSFIVRSRRRSQELTW